MLQLLLSRYVTFFEHSNFTHYNTVMFIWLTAKLSLYAKSFPSVLTIGIILIRPSGRPTEAGPIFNVQYIDR